MPSAVVGTPRVISVSSAALNAHSAPFNASAFRRGTNTWMAGSSSPAARASWSKVFSFSDQPSRTQTGIAVPFFGGGSAPKCANRLRATALFPCLGRTGSRKLRTSRWMKS